MKIMTKKINFKITIEETAERHPVPVLGTDYKVKMIYRNIKFAELDVEDKIIKISLPNKYKKANNENCDYFISIHLNSATNSSAKGCEVWLYNENIKLKNLANNLCNNLSTKMDTPNRGVKYSKNLSVLKNTKMPALLIEIDFISNKEVENNLRNDNHLKNIADTISSTLLSFVNKSIVEDKVFYRVCIGSFSNKDNAVNLKNEAICKGFKDTHIYTT